MRPQVFCRPGIKSVLHGLINFGVGVCADGVTQAKPGQSGCADTLLHGGGDIEAGLRAYSSVAHPVAVHQAITLLLTEIAPVVALIFLGNAKVIHHIRAACWLYVAAFDGCNAYYPHLPTTDLRQELLHCCRDDGVVEGLHALTADFQTVARQLALRSTRQRFALAVDDTLSHIIADQVGQR